jgi:competence protein ComEA
MKIRNTVKLNLVPIAAICAMLLGFAAPSTAFAQEAEITVATVQQVDLNAADAETLAATLKGVGLSKAKAIVAYREMYGPFSSIEELTEIKGIGGAILERNRDRLVLR